MKAHLTVASKKSGQPILCWLMPVAGKVAARCALLIILSLLLMGADGLITADRILGDIQALARYPNPDVACPAGCQTSPFGQRWGRMHEGVDIAAPTGTPVYACGHGVVVFVGSDRAHRGYGNCVDVVDGGVLTRYAHLSSFAVSPGKEVWRGDRIGTVGNTGRSYGSHLHLQININGVPVDPKGLVIR